MPEVLQGQPGPLQVLLGLWRGAAAGRCTRTQAVLDGYAAARRPCEPGCRAPGARFAFRRSRSARQRRPRSRRWPPPPRPAPPPAPAAPVGPPPAAPAPAVASPSLPPGSAPVVRGSGPARRGTVGDLSAVRLTSTRGTTSSAAPAASGGLAAAPATRSRFARPPAEAAPTGTVLLTALRADGTEAGTLHASDAEHHDRP